MAGRRRGTERAPHARAERECARDAPERARVPARRRGRLAVAGLALGAVTALAGCQVDTSGEPSVRVSRLPEEPVARSSPPPSPSDAPAAVPEPSSPAPRTSSSTPSPPPPPPDPVLMRSGQESGQVRELQARLQQLKLFSVNPTGYYGDITTASVKAFQRKQGSPRTGNVSPSDWTALRARTSQPTKLELHPTTSRPLADPDPRCRTGRALCISKKSRTLAWMVDGEVRSAMDVRFGSAYTPTREGKFKVDFKSRRHHSTIYDTPMPYALFFSGGQAVHYSADFAATGYSGASHGCVNVRDKKRIIALFDAVRAGDKVVVYK
nr:L,D-transpeptidase family protein [Streptomyces xiaopingdaonensis]